MEAGEHLLELRSVTKHYHVRGKLARGSAGTIKAVDGVTFELDAGETVGLVGESGCGKSTVARLVLQLLDPTSGEICFAGMPVRRDAASRRQYWRQVQMVFQDPYSSLNPRLTVGELVREPLRLHGQWRAGSSEPWVEDLLDLVGIDRRARTRYPAEFSGGQRQRIAIARALVLRPKVVVLDEPTAALDVSIQAQVVNLLKDLQAEVGCAYLFISHDLAVVRQLADRLVVMYLGKVVEEGVAERVFEAPSHPYTTALMSAAPRREFVEGRRGRIVLHGELPSLLSLPNGCPFVTRCWRAGSDCRETPPALTPTRAGVRAACFHPVEATVSSAAP